MDAEAIGDDVDVTADAFVDIDADAVVVAFVVAFVDAFVLLKATIFSKFGENKIGVRHADRRIGYIYRSPVNEKHLSVATNCTKK